jgi:hypothetical protein
MELGFDVRFSFPGGFKRIKLILILASRKGGARVERTSLDGAVLIHNYGAGGAGYQASW